ncbi:Uncharacterised protein [Rothia dentocariosa]|nr:Uncharacterised protein [Rothia dentocariosa]
MSGYPDIKNNESYLLRPTVNKASKPTLLYLHQNHAEKDFGTPQFTIIHTLVRLKTAPLKILQPTVSSH